MNIITLLNQINSGEIVLPAIQRDFVWSENKIQTLMDSIARGYPIGIILMWETFEDIQYRKFLPNYNGDKDQIDFHDNTQKDKLKVVLDGQQRLQSLYIALYGKYNDKYLYFDVLSGRDVNNFADSKYLFYFETKDGAKKRNLIKKRVSKSIGDETEHEYLFKVSDLFSMNATDRIKLRREISQRLKLSGDDEVRLEANLAKLIEVLVIDENILKASTIDENKPSTSPERKSESDVLEIFVRINRQGTPLTRSDLIFSMLKLNWKDSASSLPDFVEKINQGNSFALDVDFIIRCLFAVSDLGTKFDIELLRDNENINKIRQNFQQCCDAISSTIDFIQSQCWCASSKALGSYNTIVPLVYYLFHTPKHQVPNSEIGKVRKALYLFGFTRTFSRWADTRLAKLIREELKPKLEKKNYTFPLKRVVMWVKYWENMEDFGIDLLNQNARLSLYVLQHYSGAEPHLRANAPDIDHIFPRSELRKKGFEEGEINNVANYWILSKGKNQNKSAKHPKNYFAAIDKNELKRAFIDSELLDYKMYRKFLKKRSGEIVDYIREKLGFTDRDFRT